MLADFLRQQKSSVARYISYCFVIFKSVVFGNVVNQMPQFVNHGVDELLRRCGLAYPNDRAPAVGIGEGLVWIVLHKQAMRPLQDSVGCAHLLKALHHLVGMVAILDEHVHAPASYMDSPACHSMSSHIIGMFLPMQSIMKRLNTSSSYPSGSSSKSFT